MKNQKTNTGGFVLFNSKPTIYFAHSKKIYNSWKEKRIINKLKKMFPDKIIIDPNKDIGELGGIRGYLEIVKNCSEVVALEYQDHIGRGVYDEIKFALSFSIKTHVYRKGKLFIVKGVKIINSNDWSIKYGKIIL